MTEPFLNPFLQFLNLVDTQKETAVNAQNQIISTAQTTYRNPTWVCHYPLGDVTFPECLLLAFSVSGGTRLSNSGNTGAQTAGTVHTHPLLNSHYHNIVGADLDTFASALGFVVDPDCSYGAFVTISQTAIMDTIGLAWARFTGTGSINNLFIEIFKQNTDNTLTKIWTSPDQSAAIPVNVYGYIELTITPGILCQVGEVYLLRVRNSSSVATSIQVGGHPRSTISPAYSFATNAGGGATVRTTYTAAENTAGRATTQMPWFMLASVGQAVTPLSYSDDFNRSSLGSIWLTKSSNSNNIKISGNKASFDGITNADQNAIYTKAVTSDNAIVTGNITGTLLAVLGQQCGLLLHSNADMTSLVYLAITSTTCKIYSGSSTSLTQRATITRAFNDGLWSLQYDSTTTTYTALKDGADVGLSWNDSGAAKPRGADYRYGGLRISLSTLIAAGQIDNWTLRDRAM